MELSQGVLLIVLAADVFALPFDANQQQHIRSSRQLPKDENVEYEYYYYYYDDPDYANGELLENAVQPLLPQQPAQLSPAVPELPAQQHALPDRNSARVPPSPPQVQINGQEAPGFPAIQRQPAFLPPQNNRPQPDTVQVQPSSSSLEGAVGAIQEVPAQARQPIVTPLTDEIDPFGNPQNPAANEIIASENPPTLAAAPAEPSSVEDPDSYDYVEESTKIDIEVSVSEGNGVQPPEVESGAPLAVDEEPEIFGPWLPEDADGNPLPLDEQVELRHNEAVRTEDAIDLKPEELPLEHRLNPDDQASGSFLPEVEQEVKVVPPQAVVEAEATQELASTEAEIEEMSQEEKKEMLMQQLLSHHKQNENTRTPSRPSSRPPFRPQRPAGGQTEQSLRTGGFRPFGRNPSTRPSTETKEEEAQVEEQEEVRETVPHRFRPSGQRGSIAHRNSVPKPTTEQSATAEVKTETRPRVTNRFVPRNRLRTRPEVEQQDLTEPEQPQEASSENSDSSASSEQNSNQRPSNNRVVAPSSNSRVRTRVHSFNRQRLRDSTKTTVEVADPKEDSAAEVGQDDSEVVEDIEAEAGDKRLDLTTRVGHPATVNRPTNTERRRVRLPPSALIRTKSTDSESSSRRPSASKPVRDRMRLSMLRGRTRVSQSQEENSSAEDQGSREESPTPAADQTIEVASRRSAPHRFSQHSDVRQRIRSQLKRQREEQTQIEPVNTRPADGQPSAVDSLSPLVPEPVEPEPVISSIGRLPEVVSPVLHEEINNLALEAAQIEKGDSIPPPEAAELTSDEVLTSVSSSIGGDEVVVRHEQLPSHAPARNIGTDPRILEDKEPYSIPDDMFTQATHIILQQTSYPE